MTDWLKLEREIREELCDFYALASKGIALDDACETIDSISNFIGKLGRGYPKEDMARKLGKV